ncbi:hypothetical protein JAAARDRAFT_133945 [Jaapia argillacea MUCL 33604]|uniref:BAH domain-containing protein n=1 Tax=Jaapia argillacea MUCL 33604 TaxID=933084 RepID=A0A067PYB5_9AGAM|nr:hypothetical protein JAAARDRAFT_133945 [Jaapia argillacea MUCL 33604]
MHWEVIRSNPSWRKKYPRFETVLIQNTGEDDQMKGKVIGRVIRSLSFIHNSVWYPCALVQWFFPKGDVPDPLTGMWVVEPETFEGGDNRTIGLIHLDCIIRACHLVAVYDDTPLPQDFPFYYSLDPFRAFYVNKYRDYHSHECI